MPAPTTMRSRFILALLLSLAAASASAQTYRCTSGSRSYFSDRPCESKFQSYGPGREQPPQSYSSTPAIPRAAEHLQHLSPECASISEAIRTGPGRGVKYDVIRDLNDEYRRKCAVDEGMARGRAADERNQKYKAELAAREQEANSRRQAAARQERCGAMRDVISVKRRREAELNPKELDALRSLERTYNEVCIAP